MKENRLDYIPAEQDSINVLYLTTREDRCEQLTVPPPIDTLYTVVPGTFSCVNQSPGIGDFVFHSLIEVETGVGIPKSSLSHGLIF